jgi:hypothetical protein
LSAFENSNCPLDAGSASNGSAVPVEVAPLNFRLEKAWGRLMLLRIKAVLAGVKNAEN